MSYLFGAATTHTIAPSGIVQASQRTLVVRLQPASSNATKREIFTSVGLALGAPFRFHIFCRFDEFGTNRVAFGFTSSDGTVLNVVGWDSGWAAGTDHTLICTYDGANLAIYADDDATTAKATISVSATPDYAGSQDLRIGNHPFDFAGSEEDQSWDGLIHEVAWYDVALSEAEREMVFAGASPLLLPRLPVQYYPFVNGGQDIIGRYTATISGATLADPTVAVLLPADATAESSSILVLHPLAGASTGTSSAAATRLALPRALAGASVGTSAAAATTLAPVNSLSGAVVGTSSASATSLRLEHPLVGASVGTSSAGAEANPLVGASTGTSSASATTLTKPPAQFAGSATGTSSVASIADPWITPTVVWSPELVGGVAVRTRRPEAGFGVRIW